MSSGYKQGSTKAIVLEALKLGLTREEVMRKHNLTRYAVFSCEYRLGRFLKGISGKVRQGTVKAIAIEAMSHGLTIREAIAKYDVNPCSLRSAWRNLT